MITKKYLYNNKTDNYVKVCIKEPETLGLAAIYESLFAFMDPKVNFNDVFVVDYAKKSFGVLEVVVDVEDIDFSEFED